MKVVCAWRRSPKYDNPAFVYSLKHQVTRFSLMSVDFMCYTNENLPGVKTKPLMDSYEGFWCKLEVFRETGAVVYLDLDTIILNHQFGNFLRHVSHAPPSKFWMLTPFNPRETWASGIMAWHGDYSRLWRELKPKHIKKYEWDQRYISENVFQNIDSVNDHLWIRSYMHSFKDKEEPSNAVDIVCFHGQHTQMNVPDQWVIDKFQEYHHA